MRDPGPEDHTRYRKTLPNGEILRTRVLHGQGDIDDPRLWNRIWRRQLKLGSEDEFWEALRTRKPVDREPAEAESQPPAGESKPGWLVNGLISAAGLDPYEVAGMTQEEALGRWIQHCERR